MDLKPTNQTEPTLAPIDESAPAPRPGYFRQLYDIFLLFSGISTQQNLSRTRPTPVRSRGLFLFRK
jgi:hypothetical protein